MASMHGALANTEAAAGNLVAARRWLLSGIREAPDRLDLYQNLANLERHAPNGGDGGALMRCAVNLPATGTAYSALAGLDREFDWGRRLRRYRQALIIDPMDHVAATNAAVTLRDAGLPGTGIPFLQSALVVSPGFSKAMNAIGNNLRGRAEVTRALSWFVRVLVAEPSAYAFRSNLLMTAQYHPRATAASLDRLHREHAVWFETGRLSTPPAAALAAPFVRGVRPLRVAVASPNLNRHPVGRLVVGLIEHRNRDAIEFHCYSDTEIRDAFTDRLRQASDGWHETRDMLHDQWEALIGSSGADVLLDLAGHTAENRLPRIAGRLAPLQVTWAGYVGTTGLSAMDGLIADRFHVPPGEERHYVERILRMPHGYATFSPQQDIPEPSPPPCLDAGHVTFGSFNNPAKINPPLVALWARVLRAVPNSRLLLLYRALDDPWSTASIRGWFKAAGVEENRVVFDRGGQIADVMRAYGRVDIALDTRPYSGGVTTLEALWMGVPVVTWPGGSFAGRHSESHVTNAGFPELVARDADAYVNLATDLASDPARLRAFRSAARRSIAASPLMDYAGFARDFTTLLTDFAASG